MEEWRIFVLVYLCVKSVMCWNKGPSQSQLIPAAVSRELQPWMLRCFHHTHLDHVYSITVEIRQLHRKTVYMVETACF